jgi:hypothetical protein
VYALRKISSNRHPTGRPLRNLTMNLGAFGLHRRRLQHAGRWVLGIVLGAGLVLGLCLVSSAASAASLCLNSSRQFVPCYELPAGSGTQTSPTTQTSHSNGSVHQDLNKTSRNSTVRSSHFESPVAKVAAGIVAFGIVLGSISFLVGWRRHRKGPRWEDRADYRAA